MSQCEERSCFRGPRSRHRHSLSPRVGAGPRHRVGEGRLRVGNDRYPYRRAPSLLFCWCRRSDPLSGGRRPRRHAPDRCWRRPRGLDVLAIDDRARPLRARGSYEVIGIRNSDIGNRQFVLRRESFQGLSPPPDDVRLGQKRTFSELCAMSALPPKADIAEQRRHVRFVPKADIGRLTRSPRRRPRAGRAA